MKTPTIEKPDLSERGGLKNDQRQACDRRLFIQLVAFGKCLHTQALTAALEHASIRGVLYEDVNDPKGVALLTFHEDPGFFVSDLRRLLTNEPFTSLEPKPEYTMLGRTYSLGYEPDLEEVLFHRPIRTACHSEWPWAIWYPLRRKGTFTQLPDEEQRKILAEHGTIGHAFGQADYAHDIRLACHGLDKNDNDFVIGLVGKKLFPLSKIVQTMRRTKQTSTYLDRLGPFFIGKAVWQNA